MINRLQFYFKTLGFLLMRNVVPAEAIQRDYDRLAPTYDEHFSTFVSKHSHELVRKLGPSPGATVLDLACGTGTLSLALAKSVGKHGSVTGVDRSAGMLDVARQKQAALGAGNVRFVESDVRDAIPLFCDNSLDAVTCGWAIGYVNPQRLLKDAGRKIRIGGQLGIIENVRDTLAPVRQSALRVAQALPEHFKQVMDLPLRLPRGRQDLSDLFTNAGLRPVEIWEGEEVFEFAHGRDVLNWVLHTGASAGFDRVMDQAVRQQCDELFIQFIERDHLRDGRLCVAHRFVAGIARKEA